MAADGDGAAVFCTCGRICNTEISCDGILDIDDYIEDNSAFTCDKCGIGLLCCGGSYVYDRSNDSVMDMFEGKDMKCARRLTRAEAQDTYPTYDLRRAESSFPDEYQFIYYSVGLLNITDIISGCDINCERSDAADYIRKNNLYNKCNVIYTNELRGISCDRETGVYYKGFCTQCNKNYTGELSSD